MRSASADAARRQRGRRTDAKRTHSGRRADVERTRSRRTAGGAPPQPLSLAATASLDGRAIIWDLQTLTVRSECRHEAGVSQLAWVRDTPCFLSAGEEGVVRLWDVRTGVCQRSWSGHTDTVLDMAASGELVITGSEDGTARVFMLGG